MNSMSVSPEFYMKGIGILREGNLGGFSAMKNIHTSMFRFRSLILIIWLLFIIVFGYYAVSLPDVLSGNGFEYEGEYNETKNLLEKEFGQNNIPVIILFEKKDRATTNDWHTSIGTFFSRTKRINDIQKQLSPLHFPNMLKEDIAYGIVFFEPMSEEELAPLLKELKEIAINSKESNITITGEPVMVEDLNRASQEDLAKAEMIGLPIALLVLIFAFGGLVAATIPLIIGVSSILVSMGIVYFFHHFVDLSIFILNIVPMIGLALSIDFALLFINRFKEELQLHNPEEALIQTLRTAGKSIVFSGLCVFIGLSGLLFIKIDIFQNVAVGGMVVVLVSILSSLTLLPLLLLFMGKKINALPLLKMKEKRVSFWDKFAHFVMRHPISITVLSLAILLICLLPIKDLKLVIPGMESIPPNYESRVAFEKYREVFIPKGHEENREMIVVMESKEDWMEESNLQHAVTFIDSLKYENVVEYVESPFSLSQVDDPFLFLQLWENDDVFYTNMEPYIQGNKMLLRLYMEAGATNGQVRDWLEGLEERDLLFKVHLGGQIKFEQEIFNEIFAKAPYGFLLIVISTLIILTAAFRSVLIPIKAIFMNILSLGATFGIVVWIFQYGHFNMSQVSIGLILPVFVFSLVFGLSMDYEVFLIARIHEVYLETKDNTFATIKGLTSTSKIITSAAAIMIVITGAFSFTGVMPIKQIGIGIAIAIFIDATIVRLLLVPALMKLLGDWNWWFFGLNKETIKPGNH
jgi:putative drug exporter of the RND superfamily